jgi:hypothetical protein
MNARGGPARDRSAETVGAAAGALAIMMGSGAILDFELLDCGDGVFVRVWSPGTLEDSRLRTQVAALLPSYLDERHVLVEAQN